MHFVKTDKNIPITFNAHYDADIDLWTFTYETKEKISANKLAELLTGTSIVNYKASDFKPV